MTTQSLWFSHGPNSLSITPNNQGWQYWEQTAHQSRWSTSQVLTLRAELILHLHTNHKSDKNQLLFHYGSPSRSSSKVLCSQLHKSFFVNMYFNEMHRDFSKRIAYLPKGFLGVENIHLWANSLLECHGWKRSCVLFDLWLVWRWVWIPLEGLEVGT